MQLDFDFGILLHQLMELLGLQGVHVTVGQGLGSEDGWEEFPVVADVFGSMAAHLRQQLQIISQLARAWAVKMEGNSSL